MSDWAQVERDLVEKGGKSIMLLDARRDARNVANDGVWVRVGRYTWDIFGREQSEEPFPDAVQPNQQQGDEDANFEHVGMAA